MLFFFNDPATTEIYTLSLHDALPICDPALHRLALIVRGADVKGQEHLCCESLGLRAIDRKSTRLNSSHVAISYAVFCLKKKKNTYNYNDHGPYPTQSNHKSGS